jgi:hypothetical protein
LGGKGSNWRRGVSAALAIIIDGTHIQIIRKPHAKAQSRKEFLASLRLCVTSGIIAKGAKFLFLPRPYVRKIK